jgi:protein O-GlcNAc transferase
MDLPNAIQMAQGHEDNGRPDLAVDIYLGQLREFPDESSLWLNLGNAYAALGQLSFALDAYLKAKNLKPTSGLLVNIGNVFLRLFEPKQALEQFKKAIEINDENAEAYYGLGFCYNALQQKDKGMIALKAALDINPNHLAAALFFGAELAKTNPEKAIDLLERFDDDDACAIIARTHHSLLRPTEAIESIKRALSLNPRNNSHLTFFGFGVMTTEASEEEIVSFLRQISPHLFVQEHVALPRKNSARIKLAYFSADFRSHVVVRWAYAMLTKYDRSKFEVTLVYNHPTKDEFTEMLQAKVDNFLSIYDTDDETAYATLHRKFDIVVDLSGFTDGNRLPLISRRLAPLQISTIGALLTTGVPNIDIRAVDDITIPADFESCAVEKIVRLGPVAGCYEEFTKIPHTPILPYDTNGFLTFGFANNIVKLNRGHLALWRETLSQIPNHRLRIIGGDNTDAISIIKECLAGLDIEIIPRQSPENYLKFIASLDIALDSFPYTGGTTTVDCFLNGVPVAGMYGNPGIARGGLCLASAVGLSDWILPTREHFTRFLIKVSQDKTQLRRLRQSLPATTRASAIMDSKAFVDSWESMLFRELEALA